LAVAVSFMVVGACLDVGLALAVAAKDGDDL